MHQLSLDQLDIAQIQELDKVKWTNQEDDLLKKLFNHFNGDFKQISHQMNNIYFNNKFSPSLCQYRWKNYLDFHINKEEFTQKEDSIMYQRLKQEDLSDAFWFKMQEEFRQRPPAVLKQNTAKLVKRCLQYLCENLIQNKQLQMKYSNRIKCYSIELIIVFFRLGKEKEISKKQNKNSIISECIEQCCYMIDKLDQILFYISQRRELRIEQQTEKQIAQVYTLFECLNLIDTLFRIFHKVQPYDGQKKEKDNMEVLLPMKKTLIHTAQIGSYTQLEQHKNLLYDEHVFEKLHSDQIRLIYNSDTLASFDPYFSAD